MEIVPIDEHTRSRVVAFIRENWCGPVVVSRGRAHSAENLPGFVALEGGQIKGIVTYAVENGECEIVMLDSLEENRGVGAMLIGQVVAVAKERKYARVWLITTNDNTRAIRFYQKKGFRLCAMHMDAIRESRKIKPSIPLYGCDGIPILHEIEFEKAL